MNFNFFSFNLIIINDLFVDLWIIWIFLHLTNRFYRKACVEIQRLSAITRIPIHSTFQEALQGADSIRAFNVQYNKDT